MIASIAFDAALLFVVIISHVILFCFWINLFLFLPRSSLLGNTNNSICWLFSRSSSSLRLRLFAFRKLWLDLPRSPASLRWWWFCSFRKLWSDFPRSSSLLRDLLGLWLAWSAWSFLHNNLLVLTLFDHSLGLPYSFFFTTSSPFVSPSTFSTIFGFLLLFCFTTSPSICSTTFSFCLAF